MKPLAFKVSIAAIALALFAACGDEGSTMPKKERFEGILVVDLGCNVVGGDTTDFLPRPTADNYSLVYACPNPTDWLTRVLFHIPEQDSVWIFVFAEPGAPPMDTLLHKVMRPGFYSVDWTNDGPFGIYRVEMHTGTGFESFGDVLFEENPWGHLTRE